MREVDASKITEEQFITADHTQFGPIVDGRWIRDDPKEMLEKKRFKKCPIMAGVNTNEGSYFMLYELSDLVDLEGYKMNQDQLRSSIHKLFATNYDYPNIVVCTLESFRNLRFTDKQQVGRLPVNMEVILYMNILVVYWFYKRNILCSLGKHYTYVASRGTPSTLGEPYRINHVIYVCFRPFLGRRASDTPCLKCVILFVYVTSFDDAVMSYMMSQHRTCIGHMTVYYKRATNTSMGARFS